MNKKCRELLKEIQEELAPYIYGGVSEDAILEVALQYQLERVQAENAELQEQLRRQEK